MCLAQLLVLTVSDLVKDEDCGFPHVKLHKLAVGKGSRWSVSPSHASAWPTTLWSSKDTLEEDSVPVIEESFQLLGGGGIQDCSMTRLLSLLMLGSMTTFTTWLLVPPLSAPF